MAMNRLTDDDPQQPNARPARVPEVIDQYEVQRTSVVAAGRELDRRRDAVRDAAEREAAEIVSAARREIRNVLVNARRDLLVLTAQIQAVGCEPGASPGAAPDGRGEAAVVTTGQTHSEPLSATADRTAMARRQVHQILQESRGELSSLSMAARRLRDDMASRDPVGAPASATDDHAVDARLHQQHEPTDDEPTRVAEPTPVAPALTDASEPSRRRGRRVPVALALAATAVLAVFLAMAWAPWNTSLPADVGGSVRGGTPVGAPPSVPVPATAAPPVTSEGSRATSGAPVSLLVDIRRAAWIRATVDGKREAGRLYAAGETREIAASREVTIRTGDAGAVFVSVAGQTPSALGRDGQVVTRRFTATESATPAVEAKEPAHDSLAAAFLVNAEPAPAPSVPAPAPVSTDSFGTASAVSMKTVLPAATVGRETRIGGSQEESTTFARGEARSSAEAEILAQEQRWFDAYYAGDRPGMAAVATDTFTFEDEREASQRIPSGVGGVTRTLDGVRTYSAGVGFVLSARITERATVGGTVRKSVGWLSEVWVRGDDGWRLTGVRIAPLSGEPVSRAR